MYKEQTSLEKFYAFLSSHVKAQYHAGIFSQHYYTANSEAYGFNVKINNKIFKFNHNYKPIGKKSTKLFIYE